MFKKMKFKAKLLLISSITGTFSLAVIGISSLSISAKALEEQAFHQLMAVSEIKKRSVEDYFRQAFTQMGIFSRSRDIRELFDSLKAYHDRTEVQADGPYNVTTDAYRRIYTEEGNNVRSFWNESGHADIFVICAPHGHVMFSCAQKADLGTNLRYGPYKSSNLARLWKKVVDTWNPVVVDFEPYAPSNNEPAFFAGYPILDAGGKLAGVLAFQFSMENINNLMQQREGMGETGETYLIGPDKLMRSDSFLDPVNHSVKASFANPSTGSVDTEASRGALAGKTGHKLLIDYNGNQVLSAYTPVLIQGLKWGLIAEIDAAEAFATVGSLKRIIGIIVFLTVILIAVASLWVSSSVSKSIKQTTGELKAASDELRTAAHQQLNSTTEQATTTTQLSTTMKELVTASNQISKTASEVVSVSDGTNNFAKEGKSSLESAEHGMQKIKKQVDKIVKNMLSLGDKTNEMGTILEIISELAEQTTILSYNATIEAAGAGENGRRFSALAEQIMKLADKAMNSTKEIKALIEGVQKSSNKTVLATEDGMKAVGDGMYRLKVSNQHFDAILDSADESLASAKEIQMTLSQQLHTIEQTAEGVVGINEAAEEVKTSSNQTLLASEQIVTMAKKLETI